MDAELADLDGKWDEIEKLREEQTRQGAEKKSLVEETREVEHDCVLIKRRLEKEFPKRHRGY